MKRIYLDLCCLQRPLDDKGQLRIALEAEAVLGILKLWELEQIEPISSDVLRFEANQNTNVIRKSYLLEMLAKFSLFIKVTDELEDNARKFISFGIKPMDTLHLSTAIQANADYFCTCDDRFLKRAKQINTASTKITNPIELAMELNYES